MVVCQVDYQGREVMPTLTSPPATSAPATTPLPFRHQPRMPGIGQPEISNFERGLGSPTEVTLARLIAPFEYHIGFVPDSVDEREFVPA